MKLYPLLTALAISCSNTLASNPLTPSKSFTLISSGYKFTEGAALAPNGDIYFNDIPNNKTYRLDQSTQKVILHRENTGAANGLMFDAQGNLIYCEGKNRQLTREEAKGISPIATEHLGKRLNSPNDLAIDKQGGIFFTDPRYGPTEDLEQDAEGVYYLMPEGKVIRLISNLKKPNGIALHADQRTLYVADNGTGKIHAYSVKYPEVTLSDERVLTEEAPVNDGFKLDELGNLWVTTSEGIKIFDPNGKHLETLEMPEPPANLVFGKKGSKTVYVNARTGFYRIAVAVDGQ